VVEYLDKGSGARFSRDRLDAMMAEVRKGRIAIIAVYKLDRLGQRLQRFPLASGK